MLNGIGVERRAGAAFDLLKNLINSGMKKALSELGICYSNGFGVEED